MQTTEHQRHLKTRVSHNNCQECRADVERQFLRLAFEGYRYVHEYLDFVRPRLEAIKGGFDSVNARHFRSDFREALNRRITLKAGPEIGRKRCDSYSQRLNQFPRRSTDRPLNPWSTIDATYLRRFARRGASTLN